MTPEYMATRTGAGKLEPIGTAVLGQLAALDHRNLSPETARTFLALRFDRSHEQHADALSEKAQEGRLTASEQEELDEYIQVADLLRTQEVKP
jgi:hypothetical protein